MSRQPTPFAVSDTLQLDQSRKYQYRAVETSDRPPPAKRALTRSVTGLGRGKDGAGQGRRWERGQGRRQRRVDARGQGRVEGRGQSVGQGRG